MSRAADSVSMYGATCGDFDSQPTPNSFEVAASSATSCGVSGVPSEAKSASSLESSMQSTGLELTTPRGSNPTTS